MRKHTKRKALLLAAQTTLITGLWQTGARATTYTWISSSDPTWTNPANWSGNVVPGMNDAALFGTVAPPSATAIITSDQSLGALVDPLANTSSLTINGPGSGSATLTLFGQTVNATQGTLSFTGSNVILSATGLTPNAAKNLTLGSSLNLALANPQNVILGVQGAVSGGSGQGNVIQINGNISDGPGVHAGLTLLGNGDFGHEGAALDLRGSNTFSGGLTIGNPDGLNGGQVRVNAAQNLGTGSITVNWQGQLIFNTSGTYGNPGQVLYVNGTGLINNTGNSGAFRTGAASIVWNGDISIGSTSLVENTNGFVVLSSTGANTFELAGKLTGTGSLQKQGGGTLLLSGTSNDCTGATQVGNGVLTVAPGSSMSTGDLIMFQSSSNTGVSLDLYNAHQNVGNLSSTFTQTGGSFFQFINIGSNSIGGTLNIKQTTNKSYGYGASLGLTSTITGPGGISLDAGSTAALTLTGPNDYQGGTVINGGTLNLANGQNGSAVGSGDVEVKSNGHLATGNTTVLGSPVTDGTIGGNLIVRGGAVIEPGNHNLTGTLFVGGNVSANDGSIFNFDVIGGVSAVSDQIVASGALTLDTPGTEMVNINDTSSATGSFKLMSYSSLTFAGGSVSLNTPAIIGNRHYALTTTPNGVVLTITDNSSVRYWSMGGASISTSGPVDGGGAWSNGDGANFFSSNPDMPNAPYDNTSSANVVIGNGQSGDQITLGSDIRVGGTLIFGPLNGNGYTIGVPADPHTLTLVGGLSASSNATINAPIKLEQSLSVAPQAGVVVTTNGGVSELSASTTLTKNGLGTIVLNGTSTYTGGTVINSGVVQAPTWGVPTVASGVSVTDNGGLVFSQTSDGTFSGRITGTGSLGVNNGTSSTVVTLTASNAYSGATVFQNGVLQISAANNLGTGTGGWKLSGGTLRVLNDISFPSTFAAASLVNGTTTTFDTNGHTLTLGQILNGGGNLTKAGAGTLVVAGIHTTDNIGKVAISAGTLSIAPASTVSYGFSADTGGNTFQGNLLLATPIELRLQGGVISGGGTIRVKPSTVQIVSRGNVTIANTIVLNDNATPISGFIGNIGANSLNSLMLSAPITGPANVDFTGGAGTVMLASQNTYTAPPGSTSPLTTIDNSAGGEVQLLMDDPLPKITAVHVTSTGVFDLNGYSQTAISLDASSNSAELINNNGGGLSTLTINGSANTSYAGFILDGAGSVALTLASTNTGSLTLSATNTYSGGTTLNGGTLIISKNSNLGADSGSLSFGGGRLVVNSATLVRPIAVNTGGGTIDVAAGKSLSITGGGTTTWSNAILNTTDSGTVSFSRTGATVAVTPGAILSIGALSNVTVDATEDPFTDSNLATSHVAIVSNGSFSVTVGSTTIASHTGTGQISVGGGASLNFAATGSGNSASVLAVDTASGSSVDLANDAMAVNYNGASPDSTIRAALISGRASGSWSGPGINSSVSAADSTAAHPTICALGYAEASAVGITSTFFGQPVDSTTVLIRYTYLGDTNLDGKVNALDFNALASNFGNPSGTEWDQADFNYDGVTDTSDFMMLANNFGLTLAAPAQLPAPVLGSLVPEPVTLGIFAIAPVLIRRRRRR